MAKPNVKSLLLWLLIFLPYLLLIAGIFYYFHKVDEINNASFIIINKADMTLSHYDYKGNLLQKSGVATGKSFGNKKVIGDLKTPEGVFNVVNIEDASSWSHDFKDDTLGEIKGAYGPYFIRLAVPGQKGIGIHGTHDSNSIGSRASEGCIRMQNEEVRKLANVIKQSTVVVIIPGIEDVISNKNDTVNSIKKVKANLNKKDKIKSQGSDTLLKKTNKIPIKKNKTKLEIKQMKKQKKQQNRN
jgi:murein L,D-transpeptidase YafK